MPESSNQPESWTVESVRATVFAGASTVLDSLPSWHSLIGSQPEERSEQPQRGAVSEAGPLGIGLLRLDRQLSRADCHLDAEIRTDDGQLPTMPFPDALTELASLAKKWFAGGAGYGRVAFAATLREPAQDREAGYRRLAQLLPPVSIDPIGSSDFLYQINRRRASRSLQLPVNRLSRWSVSSFYKGQLTLGPEAVLHKASVPTYACRLQMELNNAPEIASSFLGEQAAALLDEFVELALEIARRGDIP